MKPDSLLAPPDATHWSPKNGSFYTERDGKFYQWGSSGIAPVLTTHDWIAQLIPVDSAAPVWNGEGLPPVGVECEAHWSTDPDVWHPVVVVGHDEGDVVFRWKGGERKGGYSSYGLPYFRPLKTPEQLAAEQRERAIEQMVEVIRGTFTWDEALGRLHDAGYRKHDQ